MNVMPRAALRGQPRRLVDDNKMLVLEQHRILDHFTVGIGDHRNVAFAQMLGIRQGRYTHVLPRRKPRAGLYAAFFHPNFALSAQLFDPPLRDMRKHALEPAVQALVLAVFINGQVLHATHTTKLLAKAMPPKSASMARMTEPPI